MTQWTSELQMQYCVYAGVGLLSGCSDISLPFVSLGFIVPLTRYLVLQPSEWTESLARISCGIKPVVQCSKYVAWLLVAGGEKKINMVWNLGAIFRNPTAINYGKTVLPIALAIVKNTHFCSNNIYVHVCAYTYTYYIHTCMHIYMHLHTDTYIISYILFTVTSFYRITSDYFGMEEDEIQKNV